MDASGHAHLMMKDSSVRLRSIGHNAGWEEDDREGCMAFEQAPGLESGQVSNNSLPLPLDHQELASSSSSWKSNYQLPVADGPGGGGAGVGQDTAAAAAAAAAGCLTPICPPISTTPSSTTTYPPTAVTNSSKVLLHHHHHHYHHHHHPYLTILTSTHLLNTFISPSNRTPPPSPPPPPPLPPSLPFSSPVAPPPPK